MDVFSSNHSFIAIRVLMRHGVKESELLDWVSSGVFV